MRKPSPATHQACRSLLQKAVRRGDVVLTERVATHLMHIGDTTWLKRRVGVIVFEECWSLRATRQLPYDSAHIVETLMCAAKSVKAKDAAGLGTLAYAHFNNDTSVLNGAPSDRDIKIVGEAMKRPDDFWNWASNACTSEQQIDLVAFAWKAYKAGGWPWDRGFIQAAAYLAITQAMPILDDNEENVAEFPFWVALDKHTPEGKVALRTVARSLKVPARQLLWVSFYLESAYTSGIIYSPWWNREIHWRLSRVGLTYDEADSIWRAARPLVADLLLDESATLAEHIKGSGFNQTLLLGEAL